MGEVQKSWSIEGSYAQWTLTVTLGVPESSERDEVPDLPSAEMQPVADHFVQVVNLYEISQDLERVGQGVWWRLR